MNFLYPLFTFAALLVAIPILIHLFNFRKYKKVFFPDIRFLKELQEQTQKSSTLKHLLILISRILAVLCLVAAFAQPYFSKDAEKITAGPKAVSIFIDNSFSMGIEKNALSLLDLAKGKAKSIIESYSSNDQFQLLTNEFGYDENKFLTKQEALQQVGQIQLSAKTKKPDIILEKQKLLLNTVPNATKQIVFISDFQKNNFPANLTTTDSIRKYFISVNATQIQNISLDTVLFETPSLLLNVANPMLVKLKNNGDEDANTSITVKVNQQLKSVVNVTLKAHESKQESISFSTSTAGAQQIQVYINDNPISFDDTFFVAGKVNASYAVMVLNQTNANAFLSSVFPPGSPFKLDNNNVNSVNPTLLKNYSLIILNSVINLSPALTEGLSTFVNNGGTLLVFAPTSNNTGNLNAFLSNTAGCTYSQLSADKSFVTNYNKSHALFTDLFVKTPDNIDLPIAYQHFQIDHAALSNEQKLFTFSTGNSFLSAYKVGNGNIYTCASSAEANASTFPKSYWFLPLIYKMAYSSSGNTINALTLGINESMTINNTKINDKTIYHISGKGIDAIPVQRAIGSKMQIQMNEAITNAGLYSIFLPNTKDSTDIGINYDRAESDLSFWKVEDLKKTTHLKNAEWLSENINAVSSINELQHGIPLWKIAILCTLLFLLIEILLIRIMK